MMLVVLAILASGAWLGLSYRYLEEYFGWDNLLLFAPFEQGMILAGVIAPLAAIWALVCALLVLSRFRRLERMLKSAGERDYARNHRALGRDAAAPLTAREPESTKLESQRMAPVQLERGTPAPPPISAPPLSAPPPSFAPAPVAPPVTMPPVVLPKTEPPAVEMPEIRSFDGAPPPLKPAAESVNSIAQEVAKALGRLQSAPPQAPSPSYNVEQRLARVSRELNAISMDLTAILCQKRNRDQTLSAYNKGDKDAFHRLLSEFITSHPKTQIFTRLVQADAAGLLHNFAIRFGDELDEAKKADPSGAMERRLRDSVIGALHSQIEGLTSVGTRSAV